MKRGEHIRVTLILDAPRRRRRGVRSSSWSLAVGALLAACSPTTACGSLPVLAVQRHLDGNDATPLWIPQLAMAAGTIVLAIAFVDELVLEWQGRAATPPAEAIAHHE